ncbi:MAG: hypothetical protein IJ457_01625 [Clostridia bacterium]|nr:hypothetical protein [Clostridia bacterium]
MKTRIPALLLACIMTVLCLAACSSGKSNADTGNGSTTANENNEFAEINEYVESLKKDFSFNGDTVSIVGKESDHCEDEEVTGNLENDALYNRMREIEEIFGITYAYDICTGENHDASPSLEVMDKVETDVMSGLGTYDLAHSNIMVGGQVMLGNSLLQPVEGFAALDFSRSWWINDIENQFGIGGHLYFLTGKIVTDHYVDPACLLFNKELAENYNIEDLYALVKSGEWTFDKMIEVSSVIPAKSGTYRLGLGNYECGLSLYFGAGFSLSDVDEDGNITLPATLGNDNIDFIDKVATAIDDNSTYFVDKRVENAEAPSFEEGEVLFSTDSMGGVSYYREKDVEFGILPMPKRDTDQKDYISYSHAMSVCSYTVSKVAKDPEKSAVIAEAMAALSEKYLEPAYYEKALKGRGTYDTESREMLDLIYAAKKVDYAATYQWGGIWELIDDAITGVKDSYVGSYTSSARFGNLKVKQLLSKIEADNK